MVEDVEIDLIESDELESEEFDEPVQSEKTEYSEESAETVVTKKVKIGGFFGQEIEIKTNSNGNGIARRRNLYKRANINYIT